MSCFVLELVSHENVGECCFCSVLHMVFFYSYINLNSREMLDGKHTYINSRLFTIGVGRNYRMPPATILAYSSRLVHIDKSGYTRRLVASTTHLTFLKNLSNKVLGRPLPAWQDHEFLSKMHVVDDVQNGSTYFPRHGSSGIFKTSGYYWEIHIRTIVYPIFMRACWQGASYFGMR